MFGMMRLLEIALATMMFGFNNRAFATFTSFRDPVESPLASINPSNRVDFGGKVSISDNGEMMAVGAMNFDYHFESVVRLNDTLTELPKAGAVLVYKRQGDAWELKDALFGNVTEGLGRYFSLSPDGKWLAVRRRNSAVDIYLTDGLVFHQTFQGCSGGPVTMSNSWAVLSCDRFDQNRGKVIVLKQHGMGWTLWAEIEGDNQGERFGFAVGIDEASNKYSLQVAISAPNSSKNSGMVRVAKVPSTVKHSYDIAGQDLFGDRGDQFGFSVSFSSNILVVGSPLAFQQKGAVSVYQLRSGKFAILDKFSGDTNDRLGRSVSVSKDGFRFAVSSLHHNKFQGFVQIYEKKESDEYVLLQVLLGDENQAWFGNSVTLNGPGSLVAAGTIRHQRESDEASVGKVQVFLDTSSFCGKHYNEGNDSLILRDTCKGVDNKLIESREECQLTLGSVGTQVFLCRWFQADAEFSPSYLPTLPPSGEEEAESDESIGGISHISELPTLLPSPNAITNKDALPVETHQRDFYGCPCNVMGECTNEPFIRDQSIYLCLHSKQPTLHRIVELVLQQASTTITMISNSSSVYNATSTQCSGKTCLVEITLPLAFFLYGDTVIASGLVEKSDLPQTSNISTFNLELFEIPFGILNPSGSQVEVNDVPLGVWVAVTFCCLLIILLVFGVFWFKRQRKIRY